jgi:hypothetical protein
MKKKTVQLFFGTKLPQKRFFRVGLVCTCSNEAVFSPNYAENISFYTVYNLILGLLALAKSLDFSALSQSCEEIIGFVMSACLTVLPSIRPSVRVEQISSYWTDFHEI